MLKKIIIALLLAAMIFFAAVYFYRYAIIRHYAEKIIRENLPSYIKIDNINFDFTNNKVSLTNFKVLNPPDFFSKYLLKINDISCRYSIMGKGIPTGLEIKDVNLSGADIRIERLKDNRINVVEMEKFISSLRGREAAEAISEKGIAQRNDEKAAAKKLSDLIKLPASFSIKNSKIVFLDNVPYNNPYIIAVESINGEVSIDFRDNYSKITNLSFTLTGNLNGYNKQTIQWVGSLNPTTPKFTMSNRFEVSDLNLLTLEPYYDRFSPFIFKKGYFSGTLVFDFNNGNIGSTNEIHLSNLAFSVKPGYENAQMWETNVPDLMRYFTAPSGDIVFDFKLKGDMANPTPYLGPISKSAITSMAMDKVASYAVDQFTQQKQGANKEMDKAKEAIDMVRGLLKKK